MIQKHMLHIIAFLSLYALALFFQPAGMAAQNSGTAGLNDAGTFLLPLQKVYLHTDKDSWHVDETIWFKAYVVDAHTHRPDTLSGNLYVELVNARGRHIRSNVLQLNEGIAHAQLILPDSLPDGNYTIRAFTAWMRNFSEDFFFRKNIYIHNPEQENFIRWSERRQNRRFNRDLNEKQEEIRFDFFPEGGHFVAGLENKLAFKAVNALGQGKDVSGRVLDGDGNEVLRFESLFDGMGCFHITPAPGHRYLAEVSFANGNKQRFSLPEATESGFLLRVDRVDDVINIDVSRAFAAQADHVLENIFLLMQNPEQLIFASEGRIEDGSFSASIAAADVPPGMARVTLFDGWGTPLGKRDIFVQHPARQHRLKVAHHFIAGEEDGTAAIELDITPEYPGDAFVPGSYSMSVLSSHHEKKPGQSGLSSYLMLESELLSPIPALLSREDASMIDEALDLLMLANAWQRFDIEMAYAREMPEIRYGFGRGLALSGTVNALASDKSVEGIQVEMFVNDDRSNIYTSTTDQDGRFVFSGLQYEGVFTVTLRTPYSENGRNLWVDLDRAALRAVHYSMDMHTRPHGILSRGDDWERVERPGTRLRQAQQSKPKLGEHYFGRPDQVIYGHDIEGHYSNMMDLLINRVTSLTIEGGRMYFRGHSGGLMDDEPLFVVDGVMVHGSTFMSVNPTDVERLEVMRGSGAAIFGSRGGSGALIIFTKRGDESSLRNFEFVLTGYQVPVDFIRREINTEIYHQLGLSKTLLWEPELEIKPGQTTRISIPIENRDAIFMLFIEGITRDGQAVTVQQRIE